MSKLNSYQKIVGKETIKEIKEQAKSLKDRYIVHINSTSYGGGVAEILNSLAYLKHELNIEVCWRVIKGSQDFFNLTKKFHNGAQGGKISEKDVKKKIYLKNNEENSRITSLRNVDLVIVHDPQPLPLINYYIKKQPWLWRCHIDITNPNPYLWNYLTQFIKKYDSMIISMDKYKKNIIPEYIVHPSIDPLTEKNKELKENTIDRVLSNHGISQDKPLISQISRFDIWKDPLGVIEAHKLIKKQVDCTLVLVGNLAADDPEGPAIYKKVLKKANNDKDIKVIINSNDNDRLVNSLQTKSSVVLQKSIREGFGLVVSEALWKGTPVVASNVGGIPLQIKNGENGYLINSIEECAQKTVHLLKNPNLAEELGKNGKEHVRQNFLITRHLMDYIKISKEILKCD